jgi:hypothetical protein
MLSWQLSVRHAPATLLVAGWSVALPSADEWRASRGPVCGNVPRRCVSVSGLRLGCAGVPRPPEVKRELKGQAADDCSQVQVPAQAQAPIDRCAEEGSDYEHQSPVASGNRPTRRPEPSPQPSELAAADLLIATHNEESRASLPRVKRAWSALVAWASVRECPLGLLTLLGTF